MQFAYDAIAICSIHIPTSKGAFFADVSSYGMLIEVKNTAYGTGEPVNI